MNESYELKNLSFVDIEQATNFLGNIMHDERVELSKIRYVPESKTLEIPFRRMFYGSNTRVIKKRILFNVYEVDLMRCLLKIYNAETYRIIDNSRVETFSFADLEYDQTKNLLRIYCNEDCEIQITLSGINIEYKEEGFKGKARFTDGFFGEFSDSKVYE